ncbi:MAG: nucleoside triphosphate diphosphatase [Desulfovibrionales bacterium]|nr:nucleoside triphosphate diphosphatase [Desulfovibrionales bacterium]
MSKQSADLSPLNDVLLRLLGPDGCPWDKRQTPASLCDYIVEEAFELVGAIREAQGAGEESDASLQDGPAVDDIIEEIGDVLFLLMFAAELVERRTGRGLAEAVSLAAAKMIRRHPHVFGDLQVDNQEQLLRNWERIKREEKQEAGRGKGLYDSLPVGLPPLLKAYRIHSKAARVGFTWDSDEEAWGQFKEELEEWRRARAAGDAEASSREFGDVVFTLVELGRREGVKANASLDYANRRFLERFEVMERLAVEQGRDLPALPLAEKNKLWERAKEEVKTRDKAVPQ